MLPRLILVRSKRGERCRLWGSAGLRVIYRASVKITGWHNEFWQRYDIYSTLDISVGKKAMLKRVGAVPVSVKGISSLTLLLIALLALGTILWCPSQSQVSAIEPSTSPKRVAWDQSRVHGFPDTPPAFQVRQLYPSLELNNPLAVSALPGTRDLLIHAHKGGYGGPGSLLRFNQDDATPNLEEFLTIDEIIYGVAFDPDFKKNGFMYVGCNGQSKVLNKICTKVLRYHLDPRENYRCDPESRHVVIEWASNGHNGGDLVFGKDQMLYVSAGDGTSDSDANHAGQDLSTLPGSMLRIDVSDGDSGQLYSVPRDNPFLDVPDARPEIWAYGLRNPWRITTDAVTGDLWAGINGQDLWETAQVVRRGENYGWSITEGSHPFQPQRERGPTPIVKPTIEHPHSEARSLTGGHVYYGSKHDALKGHYVYGDYATGMIWAAKYLNGNVVSHRVVARTTLQISGFGVDHDGELIIVDYGGGLYQLAQNTRKVSTNFPRLLSQTGIYTSVESHKVHPGLIPYQVNSPLWSDGAVKERFIGIPGTETIAFRSGKSWDFPDGTVLVKTFSLPMPELSDGTPRKTSLKRVETRLMTRQEGEWFGYSYRWNEDQSDAILVDSQGRDEPLVVASTGEKEPWRKQTWHYPSRSECMVCHSRASNFVLGLSVEQTNLILCPDETPIEQLEYFRQVGLFHAETEPTGKAGGFQFPSPIEELPRLANPASRHETLEDRVRSYLHSNCANCHVKEGGGNAKINLSYRQTLAKTGLLNVAPLHDRFGKTDAKLISPQRPDESILLERLNRRGPGQMPPLATNLVDSTAVKMIEQWIKELPTEDSAAE